MHDNVRQLDFTQLAQNIKMWAAELGFQQAAITDYPSKETSERMQLWLAKKFHGTMSYLEKNNDKRAQPALLVPNTLRIISVRMNYLAWKNQTAAANSHKACISSYALGRDYHKVVRQRLRALATKITQQTGAFNYRAFADSAPVFEKPLAAKSGLGWMGKNTLIINKQAGSWFFLGELFTDLPLPIDEEVSDHCGSCTACIDVCPTGAIVAPYQLDARRCISYLTIEFKGSIPVELREAIGNRIFGCDDCQLICPWNKFAKMTDEHDFQPRHGLENKDLLELFSWSEEEFLKKSEGSAIRRAGYISWLRNIAVALGNAPYSPEIVAALTQRLSFPSEIVREHCEWALERACSRITQSSILNPQS